MVKFVDTNVGWRVKLTNIKTAAAAAAAEQLM